MAQNPIVTITMENGDVIKAELYPEIAPNTVNNFISLINHNFYDGVIFHRVIKGFMLQGGYPTVTLVRVERENLWELAKTYHSSVEQIRAMNDLEEEISGRLLLIPKAL